MRLRNRIRLPRHLRDLPVERDPIRVTMFEFRPRRLRPVTPRGNDFQEVSDLYAHDGNFIRLAFRWHQYFPPTQAVSWFHGPACWILCGDGGLADCFRFAGAASSLMMRMANGLNARQPAPQGKEDRCGGRFAVCNRCRRHPGHRGNCSRNQIPGWLTNNCGWANSVTWMGNNDDQFSVRQRVTHMTG